MREPWLVRFIYDTNWKFWILLGVGVVGGVVLWMLQ